MHLSIHESQVKRALLDYLGKDIRVAEINDLSELDFMSEICPWVRNKRLVAKPDLLMGKRCKNGLIALNKSFEEIKEWVHSQWGREISVNGKTAILDHFLVEPYLEHEQTDEYYFCIRTAIENDLIHLSTKGGVEIESNWKDVRTHEVGLGRGFDSSLFIQFVKNNFAGSGFDTEYFYDFVEKVYNFFVDFGFVYLEVNPLVIQSGEIYVLDMKSRLDSSEEWRAGEKWKRYFKNYKIGGSQAAGIDAERRVAHLDSLTGSSLKLKILNPNGSIWPLVAGGGASILIADAVVARGLGDELGFYGEYSGNPDKELVEEYADIIIRALLDGHAERQKTLLIAGGIANFTDVVKTFGGIIGALEKNRERLREQKVKVLVRRGGPNYKRGLERIKEALDEIGLVNEVHGPEIGITKIVEKI